MEMAFSVGDFPPPFGKNPHWDFVLEGVWIPMAPPTGH
jgi:hypothetical protein